MFVAKLPHFSCSVLHYFNYLLQSYASPSLGLGVDCRVSLGRRKRYNQTHTPGQWRGLSRPGQHLMPQAGPRTPYHDVGGMTQYNTVYFLQKIIIQRFDGLSNK